MFYIRKHEDKYVLGAFEVISYPSLHHNLLVGHAKLYFRINSYTDFFPFQKISFSSLFDSNIQYLLSSETH
jgi:hypothetical protein